MNVIVFLGPSLPVAEASAILDATYLPPVAQADLLSAVTTLKPDVIGIVDGVFGQSLSVWHKEILFALEKGVRVFGASSMGALRAVETEMFGTVGVGQVFAWFKDGTLNDDDEVALLHGGADSGYQKLSEPMVNLRTTFRAARESGIVGEDLCETLIQLAKGLFYPQRTFANIFSQASEKGVSPDALAALRSFVREHYVDVKKADARKLLETIRDLPPGERPAAPAFSLNRTRLFTTLYNRDRTVRHDDVDVPLFEIANHAALHLPDFAEINFQALNRVIVAHLARYFEISVRKDGIAEETQRFRVRRGLQEDASFLGWLDRNDLTMDEFASLMESICLCRRLQEWFMTRKNTERNTQCLLDELRLKGRFEETAGQAAGHEKVLQENYPDFRYLDHGETSLEDLLIRHLKSTGIPMEIPWERWCEEAGFSDPAAFKIALLRSKLFDDHMSQTLGAW